MKKIFLVLVLTIAGSYLCFAQQLPSGIAKATLMPVEIKIATGRVESIALAGSQQGAKSEIVIKDESGTGMTFKVSATAFIYDKGMQAITLDKILKGDRIRISYRISKDGENEVNSINTIR